MAMLRKPKQPNVLLFFLPQNSCTCCSVCSRQKEPRLDLSYQFFILMLLMELDEMEAKLAYYQSLFVSVSANIDESALQLMNSSVLFHPVAGLESANSEAPLPQQIL